MALVQNDVSYYADLGLSYLRNRAREKVYHSTLYPEVCQIITTKETGITSVADFAGKRIAVGAAGSRVNNARQILAAYGLSYEDIKPQYLSFAEAAAGLKDGNIDAGITAGTPTSAVLVYQLKAGGTNIYRRCYSRSIGGRISFLHQSANPG